MLPHVQQTPREKERETGRENKLYPAHSVMYDPARDIFTSSEDVPAEVDDYAAKRESDDDDDDKAADRHAENREGLPSVSHHLNKPDPAERSAPVSMISSSLLSVLTYNMFQDSEAA